ncbi:hypothetical protein CK486_08420 [Pseudomonas sp. HAR-UPW-AIA-41]|uniref:hypothetical protein n=1 Tax=Pseudomonas sp. HAR-UPW-AIA-41 TaxID=1985301 RepID=UPI000BB357CA|nr:hypothetical protein [Pseudomonas sp. HAR-UPW-AIA-41]PAV48463.1 hypothetical protein CK486_08420 [Pseudomonas sp. HAR-UPW-AIA-41]
MTKGKKLSRGELESQLEHCRTSCRNHWLGKGFTSICKTVMWLGIAYFTYMAIAAMAGKQTTAQIDVQAVAGLSTGTQKPSSGKADTVEKPEPAKAATQAPTGTVQPMLPSGWLNLLCILVGAGGVFYGRRQADFRRSVVERFQPYIAELEQTLDPNRTSSDLPLRGGTRLEDV